MLDAVLQELAAEGATPALAAILRRLVAAAETGGLNGLIERFTASGSGPIVESWIVRGPNLPVSPQELQAAIGEDRLQFLAQQAGIPVPELLSALSRYLPSLVDRLTPEGRVPAGGYVDPALGAATPQLPPAEA